MDAYEAWNWAEHMLQPLGRRKRVCVNHILAVPMLFCLEHVSQDTVDPLSCQNCDCASAAA